MKSFSEFLKEQHGDLYAYFSDCESMRDFLTCLEIDDFSEPALRKICLDFVHERLIPAEGAVIDYEDLANCIFQEIMGTSDLVDIIDSIKNKKH